MAGRGARAAVEVAADLVKMDKDYLVLKRASASRLSGEWNDDDFDVLADGVVVGRIIRRQRCRWGSPGCGRWRLAIMRTAPRRTATSREAAMAAFAKSWGRE